MPEFYLVKTDTGSFVPATDDDKDITNKLVSGCIFKGKTVNPRSYENHKRFFAMVKIIFDNQDKYDTIGELLIELKLISGHYKIHVTNKGEPVYVPKSIRFEKMDEIEFREFFDNVIDAALSKKLLRITKEKLLDELQLKILDFS